MQDALKLFNTALMKLALTYYSPMTTDERIATKYLHEQGIVNDEFAKRIKESR